MDPDELEYVPTLHESQFVAPVAEKYLPASHGVQIVAPFIEEYDPIEQCLQYS